MGLAEKEKQEQARFLEQLGAHISKIRAGKSISVSELARRCFMDKPNLIRIEKGRVNPSIYALKRIANALEISLKELLEDFDE
jgi:putative transcriptional regulator